MESRKDFGLLDEADIKLVIDDADQAPIWTGEGDDMPSPEILAQAKSILLRITGGPDFTTEELNATLAAFQAIIPSDALFLYTIATDGTTSKKGKRLELYVK